MQKTLLNRKIIDNPIFNFIWFYAIWLSCVIGKESWLVLPVLLLTIHFLSLKNRQNEIILAITVTSIGIVVDGYLSLLNVFIFSSNTIMPVWLALLWMGFGLTLQRGLKFLNRHWLLASVLGGIGGTSSYISGYTFGAVEFSYSLPVTAAIIFFHWSILMPVLMVISQKLTPAKRNPKYKEFDQEQMAIAMDRFEEKS